MKKKPASHPKIHFIGMGGIGMSGLARLYLSLGHPIQGSDVQKSDALIDLERLGADVFIGHDASHISGADRVVYSSSIPVDHPERLAAARRGVSVIHRSEALAELCRGKSTIAITGTHGKTTTTAMIGVILEEAGRDPSVAVGGVVRQFGGNARLGTGPEIVIEADESDSSFLSYLPDFAVVTNIDREHMENFGSMEAVEKAYEKFISRLPEDGLWIGCGDDERILKLAGRRIRPSRLYGLTPHTGRFWADNIQECFGGEKGVVFTAWFGDRRLGEVRLQLIGRHNVLNALAALAMADHLGVSFEAAAKGLSCFEGVGRRFDVRLRSKDFWVVDDYAHHPTELLKTLSGARRLGRRIVALFQPHRYSRTEDLFQDFLTAFGDVDKLLITDVYAASEAPREGITGERLAAAVSGAGHPDATYVSREKLVEVTLGLVAPGDLILTLGAGDITRASFELVEKLRNGWVGAGRTGVASPALFGDLRGTVRTNEPLSKHTSLKIGGPADYWIEPEDEEDLRALLAQARRRSIPLVVFGAGSNILAHDGGFRGAVISLGSAFFKRVRVEDAVLIAGAGVPNTLFITAAIENGFGGFEFLSGIPGQIGGAVAMNAGSHGQSVDATIESVRVIDYSGEERVLKRGDMGFGYRHSGIRNGVIVEARFMFPRTPAKDVRAKLEEYREYRSSTQDLWHASAGCLFKNPGIPGRSSGKLIDEAGLKGLRVGQAQISEKHANFLINLGGATAADVRDIIERARTSVREKFGIELETEVEVLEEGSKKNRLSFVSGELPSAKIAILAGGPSCEREISLVSGKAVEEALTAQGIATYFCDPDPSVDFVRDLRREGVTAVFNVLHGSFGEDGTVQEILDRASIPYTGSGAKASQLAFDKSVSQALFRERGLRVPEFWVLAKKSVGAIHESPLRLPVVVKPACAGSSVGVTIVRREREFGAAVTEAFRWSDHVLVESFIAGRELTVGILGDEPLPVVEIIAKCAFYDYQAKYQSAGTEYRVPAELSDAERSQVQEMALSAYRALGCRAMARADLILSPSGEAYLLEVNTIPGLTGRSLLPKAAAAAGIDFSGLCVKILELSLAVKAVP